MTETFKCGHDMSGHNVYYNQQNGKQYGPYCRTCRRIRAANPKVMNPNFYPCWHPRTEENTYTSLRHGKYKNKRCKICRKAYDDKRGKLIQMKPLFCKDCGIELDLDDVRANLNSWEVFKMLCSDCIEHNIESE